MPRHIRTILTCVAASVAAFAAQPSKPSAQPEFRVVSYMNGYEFPTLSVEGSPGQFYVTATIPSTDGMAALSVNTKGQITTSATFPKTYLIDGVLIGGPDGHTYAATQNGSFVATTFSVTAAPNSLQAYPPAQDFIPALYQNLPDGNLLGSAAWNATAYLITLATTSGVMTSFYQFPQDLPYWLIYANDGNYYGTAITYRTSMGYVFKVTPSGTLTKLYEFPANTFTINDPYPIVQGADGNLYGATPGGGANGAGMIYKLTLSGDYTLLYTFTKKGSYAPVFLIEGSDGNLYGDTTYGSNGQLFRVTKSGQFTPLHNMSIADGICGCQLIQGSDGILYGSAGAGGIYGSGTVFALDIGLPKPVPSALSFTPQSGAAGTQVRIWGYNLLSAAVKFNGVAATSVANSGANYVLATVPAGATTGPITVTTPGGSSTTQASFTVQ